MSIEINSSTASQALPSTAFAASAAPASITTKVDAQATKIPAIKFTMSEWYGPVPTTINAIYIPSIGVKCIHSMGGKLQAYFSNGPESGTVTTPTEVDSVDIPIILETAKSHQQFVEAEKKFLEAAKKLTAQTNLLKAVFTTPKS